MSNFLNIPKCSPLRFLPNTLTPGVHFYDDWAYNQIKSFQMKVKYYQKWQRGDETPIQVQCSFQPDDLKIYDGTGTLKKSFPFTIKANGGTLNYSVYETAPINIDNLPDGIYYAFFRATFLTVTLTAISEPIHLKDVHLNTHSFQYWHSYNKHGVIFTTGIKYLFRCEAGIMDMQPDRERTSYVDQTHNISTLDATPFNTYKLYIADAKGVYPYIVDILNRIYCCDHVLTQGLQYETLEGAKWEITRQKGYYPIGASIDVTEAQNTDSLQINDLTTIPAGIVAAYQIDTGVFGTAPVAHIIDIIETH